MLADFFKNLPWWIQYPGKALAALCGGYVSNHPEIFPSWAVVVGALVALWVVVAFLWHALNALRVHQGKTRFRLDLNLIIIACLTGALGVALWQAWRGAPSAVVAKEQVPAQVIVATSDIPGIPATKAGLSQVLDVLLPKISGLMSYDARTTMASFQRMPNEAIDGLLTPVTPAMSIGAPGPRKLADARVKASVALLQSLLKGMSDLQEQNKLNKLLVDWILGDINIVPRAIGNSELLGRQMAEIALPPAYNTAQLVQFWELGITSARLRDQVGPLNDWILAVESRAQKVQTEFGKRVSQ